MTQRIRAAVLAIGAASGLLAAPMASATSPPLRGLTLPATPNRYSAPKLPAHFEERWVKALDTTPADNPVTDAGATLGRVLFYDTRLSANDSTSCGSCHVQKSGFADPNPGSRGFHGGTTDRHAMNLVNLRYHPRGRFFWDERGGNLESMVLLPVENRLEMGEDLSKLPAKLATDTRYAELFRRAFGDPRSVVEEPAKNRVGFALVQPFRRENVVQVHCEHRAHLVQLLDGLIDLQV